MNQSPRAALPGEINFPLFDRYTLAHAAMGAVLGAVGVSPRGVLALAVGWEVVERPLKVLVPAIFPSETQDSLLNSAGDIAAMVGGAYLTRRKR